MLRGVNSVVRRNFAGVPPKSFHKRPLPANLIALSSPKGKQLFREALDEGGMGCYFPLAEQFITQSEPSYCSISTLAMVLNALNYDPKRIWKGAWRWVSEEMLNCESQAICGHSLERIKSDGLSFSEFESLARCHGVRIHSSRVCHGLQEPCGSEGFNHFKAIVEETSRSDLAKKFTVVNFSRKYLNQTGDGHYSPIGGYHKKEELVLILDVARFKYPPYWVKVSDLWESMAVKDKASGNTRGYFVISGWDEQEQQQESVCSSDTCHHHQHDHHIHHHHQKPKEETVFTVVKKSCPPTIRTWQESKIHDHGHAKCKSHSHPQ